MTYYVSGNIQIFIINKINQNVIVKELFNIYCHAIIKYAIV